MMFVSYSRCETRATRALVEALARKDVECWFDEANIPVGQAFVERLGEALRMADSFLLVDTPASRSSYWVSRESQTASRYRIDGRYRSVLRLYSLGCERTDAASCDASMLFNHQAPDLIARFLAGRRTAQRSPNTDAQVGSVTFLNSSGLGQPSNWTGRQDDLRALDEWWLGSVPGAWIQGLGGSGKSGLIQTWVTALSSLGYREPVSANVLYLRGSEVNDSETLRILRTSTLSATSPSVLLILDGHDEAQSTREVEEILAKAIQLGARSVVTSRASIPGPLSQYFTNLGLPVFTRRDSVAVLSQFGVTGPESEALAAELGDFPLALFLVSRYLASGNKTAAEALDELRGMRADRLSAGPLASDSIRATLRNTVEGLTMEAKLLLETLCRNAVSIPEPTALANPAISELARAGLVQVDHLEGPSQVSIHPLVRRYVSGEEIASMDKQRDIGRSLGS